MSEGNKKTIILTCKQLFSITLPCKEKYKGIELMETPHGTIAFRLGATTRTIEVATIDNAKVVIDEWNDLKLN